MSKASRNQLLEVVCAGNVEAVQALLDNGTDPNSASPSYDYEREWSPLITAIVHDHPEVVRVLLDAGADCKCFYNLDDYPKTVVTKEIKTKLRDLNVSCTALYTAAGFGNPQIVQMLLESGAAVDSGDGNDTPLNLAIKQQNLAIIRTLLNAGSDVNLDMEDEERAVMTAASAGNLEIVQILVDVGATLEEWSQGESALSLAAQCGHEDIYEYLFPLVSEEHQEYAPREMLEKGIKKKSRRNQKKGSSS
jgi:ankyrin repeat protein